MMVRNDRTTALLFLRYSHNTELFCDSLGNRRQHRSAVEELLPYTLTFTAKFSIDTRNDGRDWRRNNQEEKERVLCDFSQEQDEIEEQRRENKGEGK